jgi:mannosylglycerate hydrolase
MPYTLTIVSHTHWDREWYQPFQEYRIRLVQLTDRLLDLLARDPDYRYFTFDGQTIVLQDYLEVRPEQEETLRRYVQEGRLLIGPWHVLPDEFLVSPEATIRNLMLGDEVARRFGARMPVGYIPDPFGHVGQLPQILRGFGLDVAVFWRGAGRAANEFRWAAPDGSEVLAIHLRDGYGNAAHLPDDEAGFVARLRQIVAALAPHATTPHLLAMNGTDHQEPSPHLSRLIAAARARLPDVEIRHGTLPQFVAAVRAASPALELRHGEMRSSERANLLPGVFSARTWIKQRNARCETLLEKWAEPFPALAALYGLETPTRDLSALTWQAWRILVQNHPHDSICGCSVDAVHKEMDVRFDGVEQIGEEVTRQSLAAIAQAVDTTALPGAPVVVFNPLAGPRSDVAAVEISLPPEAPAVEAIDERGVVAPGQVTVRRADGAATVRFVARDVPGHGYKAFALRAAPPAGGATPPADGYRIENEFYAVEADPATGALTVSDKTSGAVWRGLHRFVDGGDRGDEYNYCPPERDRLVTAPAAPPTVRLVESGPVCWTLEIAQTYRVPAGLTADRAGRSDELADLPLATRVSLSPGVRRIDLVTTVENRAGDHRLRVYFPTPICTDVSHAEGHFDVVTRPLALPRYTEAWVEQPASTHHQRTFVDVNDGRTGLLVANRGLPEYEVIPGDVNEDGGVTVALTLLRCVGWLSRDDLSCRREPAGPELPTPGAQCLGAHTFEYALAPHGGGWENACAQAHAFNAPLRAVAAPASNGPLPPSLSFVQVEPPAFVLTAIKRAEDGRGLIGRGYNVGRRTCEVTLRLARPLRRATRVNLNEEPQEALKVSGGAVRLTARARQIVTVKLETVR